MKRNNLFHISLSDLNVFANLNFLGVSENNLQMSDIILNTEDAIVPLLTCIDISNNNITHMDWNIVTYLPVLSKILLANNPIKDLNLPIPSSINQLSLDGVFKVNGIFYLAPFTHLTKLKIAQNGITELFQTPAVPLLKMTLLSIEDNWLQVLNLDYFNEITPKLQTLDAGKNNINKVFL